MEYEHTGLGLDQLLVLSGNVALVAAGQVEGVRCAIVDGQLAEISSASICSHRLLLLGVHYDACPPKVQKALDYLLEIIRSEGDSQKP